MAGVAADVAVRGPSLTRRVLAIGWHINTLAAGALLGVWLGITYITANPADYTHLAALRAAVDLMPIRIHGIVFLCLGVLVLVGYGRQRFVVAPLIMTSAYLAFWVALFVVSWFHNHHAPLSGVPLYLFGSVSAAASAMTASAERYG